MSDLDEVRRLRERVAELAVELAQARASSERWRMAGIMLTTERDGARADLETLRTALSEHRCGDCGGLVRAVFDPDEDYDCRTCKGLRAIVAPHPALPPSEKERG